ncbi:MAG: bifunctional precorrin-2 dehydrogenase/sirohydrochlorin ferrochelatase [Candidatus Latescibacteria bacterium]|nr:bifunctional precorrin-2 dehydrogenase/sirohydrochlorin ferrochelatase [Candidatus Latescibacterota bacterium]
MIQSLNPYFQIGLDIRDQPCLVIGGGREATEKSGRLLEAGARLVLVSPQTTQQLDTWAREGRLELRRRRFQETDLEGVLVVVNTVQDDTQLAQHIADRAAQQRFLLNTFDRPEYSNFGMVALVHPGHLRLTISTSNASPALARRLRQDLEGLFDDDFVDFLALLAQIRQRVKERVDDPHQRAALLRSLVADFKLAAHLDYPTDWRSNLNTLLDCELDACGTAASCPVCPLAASAGGA